MTPTPKHSPLPWRAEASRNIDWAWCVRDSIGGLVLDGIGQFNAEFIVAAVNERGMLLDIMVAGYVLSTWAASIRWDGSENTPEWLDTLRQRIAAVQNSNAKLDLARRKP